MKKTSTLFFSALVLAHSLVAQTPPQPKPAGPAAFWSFEQLLGGAPNFRFVYEPTARTHDKIEEFPTLAEGVVGNALKLDGLSSSLIRKADNAPALGISC